MEYSICKNPRPGKRAASYSRFSSQNQRSESIEIQEDNNLAYCAINDLDVVAMYKDEAKTGRTTQRADLQRMVADAKAGLFDYVVIYKVTRIMRNRDEMALLRITLKKYGVEILYSGEDIGTGSDGILQLGLKEVLAEWESAQLGERVVDGIQKNAERCMANGNTLYGWDIVDGYYVIDEIEAGVLRRAKNMLFSGKTPAEATRAIEGNLTRYGNPITLNTLIRLLKRRQNAGVYCYAGHEVEGGMPALWSMEEQKMLWKILGNENRPRRKAVNADFFLTGKLWCGKCNSPMSGTSGTSKTGKTYYYYKDKKGCRRQVRKDVLEQNVADAVLSVLSEEETREKIADMVMEFEESNADTAPMSSIIAEEMKAIETKYINILNAIEQGITPPGAKERIAQLQEQEEVLREELRAAEILEAATLDRDRVLFWLENAAEATDTKTLIDVFVAKVVLVGDDLHIVMHFDDPETPPKDSLTFDGEVFDQVTSRRTIGELVEHQKVGYHVAWRTLVIVAKYKKTPR